MAHGAWGRGQRAWRMGQMEIVGSEEAGKQGDWEVEKLGSWEGVKLGRWIVASGLSEL